MLKYRKISRKRPGFTMMELMASVVLSILIFLAVTPLLDTGITAFATIRKNDNVLMQRMAIIGEATKVLGDEFAITTMPITNNNKQCYIYIRTNNTVDNTNKVTTTYSKGLIMLDKNNQLLQRSATELSFSTIPSLTNIEPSLLSTPITIASFVTAFSIQHTDLSTNDVNTKRNCYDFKYQIVNTTYRFNTDMTETFSLKSL